MAQDWYAAFGIGEDGTHINSIDADGVALSAIQGLNEIVQEKDQEILALKAENASLKDRVTTLEGRLAALERGGVRAGSPGPLTTADWQPWGAVALAAFCLIRRRR